MRLPIVYHADYEAALKPGHRFPMSKYGYLRGHLGKMGLVPPGGFFAPVEASEAMLEGAHDPAYIDRVLSLSLTVDEVRRIGLPATRPVARRARLASAGTALAARLALEHGIACNAAGGSHHAARASGSGYCVFNDVAVAATALLAEGVIGSALVLDLDVHQGDGTAHIFAKEPRVFTLSLHGARNFPARKAVSDLDVPLADGAEDSAYLAALEAALEKVEALAPDVIFYNAGVDVLAEDRLGRLSLTAAGLRARDARVCAWANARACPLVGVLGGGYGPDPDAVAVRHAVLFEEAAKSRGGDIWPGFSGASRRSLTRQKPRIRATIRRRSPLPP